MSDTSRRGLALIISAALLSSCSLKQRESSTVGIWVDTPQPGTTAVDLSRSIADGLGRVRDWGALAVTAPTNVDDFHCYGINVMGPGLNRSTLPDRPTDVDPSQWSCDYPGVTSTLVGTNGGTIQLKVPAGPSRTIQMVGLRSDVTCKLGMNMRDFEDEVNQQYPNVPPNSPSVIVQEIGRTTVDLFNDASVEINSNFSENRGYPYSCGPRQGSDLQLPLVWVDSGIDTGALGMTAMPTSLPIGNISGTYNYQSTSMTPTTRSQIANLFNSNPFRVTGSANSYTFARIDLFFDASAIPASKWEASNAELVINIRAIGGNRSGSSQTQCDLNDFQAGLFKVSFYNRVKSLVTPSFLAVGGMNETNDPDQNTQSGTATGSPMAYNYGPPTYSLATMREPFTGGAPVGNFVHVQVRSGASGVYNSACSSIQLYGAAAKLRLR